MLGKLLKYEIKATGRIFLPLYMALLVFAIITKFTSAFNSEQWATPAIISMVIYITIMVGMFVMTFVMMIQRFHKNLLSDEGYLMHTLPVRPWQHITSKLLISMLWVIVSGVAAFISILIIALGKGDFTLFSSQLASLYNLLIKDLGASVYILGMEMIIGSLLSLASLILIVYASIAIGHLFNKHKLLASFGAFIGLNSLSQVFFSIISKIPGIDNTSISITSSKDLIGMLPFIQLALLYTIVITGLICAAYFAIANFILNKRLNLE